MPVKCLVSLLTILMFQKDFPKGHWRRQMEMRAGRGEMWGEGHPIGCENDALRQSTKALGLEATGEEVAQNLCSFGQMKTWSSLPHLPSTPFYQLTSLDPGLVGDP